jgi:hypothetical protein
MQFFDRTVVLLAAHGELVSIVFAFKCVVFGLDVLLCWQLGGFGCMQLPGVIEVPLAAHAIVCGHPTVTRQSLSSLWHSKEGRRIRMDRSLHEGCSEVSEREPEHLLRYTLQCLCLYQAF